MNDLITSVISKLPSWQVQYLQMAEFWNSYGQLVMDSIQYLTQSDAISQINQLIADFLLDGDVDPDELYWG